MAKDTNPIKGQLRDLLEKQSQGNKIKSLDYKPKDPNNDGRGAGVYCKWQTSKEPNRWLFLGSSFADALAKANSKQHIQTKLKT